MRSSLQLLKSGFHGSISPSSSPQLSCQELKQVRSKLKEEIIEKAKILATDLPIVERKLVMSMVIPVLDSINDKSLLEFISISYQELREIYLKYMQVENAIDVEIIEDTPKQLNLFEDE
jgi:hypothetical protein